jgi:hypothetical protein
VLGTSQFTTETNGTRTFDNSAGFSPNHFYYGVKGVKDYPYLYDDVNIDGVLVDEYVGNVTLQPIGNAQNYAGGLGDMQGLFLSTVVITAVFGGAPSQYSPNVPRMVGG